MNLTSFFCQDVKALILLRVQPAFIVSTASRLRCCSIFVGRLLIYTALAKGVQNPFSYLILYIDIPNPCHQIFSKKVFSTILTMKRIPSLRFFIFEDEHETGTGPGSFALPMLLLFPWIRARPPDNNFVLEQVARDTGSAFYLMIFSDFTPGAVEMWLISLEWIDKIPVLGQLLWAARLWFSRHGLFCRGKSS
jgi:hypothetical protein